MTLAKLLEQLGWPDNISIDDARAERRKLLMALHPDRGGNADQFHQTKDLCDRAIEKLAARASICTICKGTGVVSAKGGFGSLTAKCGCKSEKIKGFANK